VSKGRLTRQELGWLLTQEAQGAAERLRKGVSALTQPPPAPDVDTSGVDASLSALDDTMRMLSSLHSRPVGTRGRRGRIDIASLLWEVAPDARVSIEPGSGTEVFGDEAELRRMLHVMLGHGAGTDSTVSIRREGDEVALSVLLGPDSTAAAETERAWLSRMATRYGGRYELEGGVEVLALPAEGLQSRDDLARLKRELDEARRQGAAYARELAAVWTATEEGSLLSTNPPPDAHFAGERTRALVRFSSGIASTLRAMLSPVGHDLAELRTANAPKKGSADSDAPSRAALDETMETVRRHVISAQDFVAELAAIGEVDPHEPPVAVDLVALAREQARAMQERSARVGVDVRILTVPAAQSVAAPIQGSARALGVLVRLLLSHAVAASSRGAAVVMTVFAGDADLGARIAVDDSGTHLPAAARRGIVALEVEPGTFGRPSGVALFAAAEIAASQGARFDVGDAVADDGTGGGVRVTVTFPR
jgi:hypothetical protein